MAPIAFPFSFSQIAKHSAPSSTFLMTSRLSSIDRCGGHPAIGPTSGSPAYSNRNSASVSFHFLSINLSISIVKTFLSHFSFASNKKINAVQTNDRFALRLSVWHFDFFCFSVFEANHAGIFAFGAEQRKIFQHRMGPQLRSRFSAAFGTAKPIHFRFQGFHPFLPPHSGVSCCAASIAPLYASSKCAFMIFSSYFSELLAIILAYPCANKKPLKTPFSSVLHRILTFSA